MAAQHDAHELLYGVDDAPGLCGVAQAAGGVRLWWRRGDKLESEIVAHQPYFLVSHRQLLDDFKPSPQIETLSGDNYYRYRVRLKDWATHDAAAAHINRAYKLHKADYPDEPLLAFREPSVQYLLASTRTHYTGMALGDLSVLYIALRAYNSDGADYADPAQPGDRVVAVGLSDGRNWLRVFTLSDMSSQAETVLLGEVAAAVAERDPDVIVGHDLFKGALSYFTARAKQHRVKLPWGRDGSLLTVRTARAPAAEKQLEYPRADAAGRSFVDTWFLATYYDIVKRDLERFDAPYIAHYLDHTCTVPDCVPTWEVARLYDAKRTLLEADVRYELETCAAIFGTLIGSYFAQAQMLPLSLQDCVVRGNATKINYLLLREYLQRGASIPAPVDARTFIGGYTELRHSGVLKHVLNVDVASLYPSLMLSREVRPASDSLGVFKPLLTELTRQRLAAKQEARTAQDEATRVMADARQAAFKVFINSFFGYMGAARMNWADPAQAEFITQSGQEVVKQLAAIVEELGASVIEIDTDGIYLTVDFDAADTKLREHFVKQVNERLGATPVGHGITVELSGYYPAMLSYKVKNYALLEEDGSVTLTGSGMKSRGLEPFLRDFIEQGIGDILRGAPQHIETRYAELKRRIETRTVNIKELAKTETLVDSLESYRGKVELKSEGASGRNRAAAYEIALKARRPLRPGDMVAYYITGEKHTVKAFEAARPLRDYDPAQPDYNIAYYVKKLDENLKKVKGYITPAETGKLPLEQQD